ncbi:proteophosphoglycan ppg4 [Moniliophthora roreri MCA 2997]|uniref:Proteophosphoglycan ppg4 n=1 Tax=Moniliophthora roreri (strain MCA 2997) TaxID=1381753 RepID=V2X8W9_MONRO|nr:proteophosphoglycan ppg4 [Moniliophthora roreri MCA 2997]
MKKPQRPELNRIKGDQIEQDRIQLEHNLQNTDLSIRLSSQDEYDDSIEYPRHNSGPSPFNDFGSFIHRSGEHFDGDIHNAWSYRTGDDDEGIHPYEGGTMSTAAHHASALTLTAGLGGQRGARREVSLSGAEYDPDRPLHAMLGGVDSKLSIFDNDPSRSKYSAAGAGLTFDPLVVDSTAELDRLLQSGHAPPPSLRSRADLARSNYSSSASSSSDSESPSRPKITDALRRVSFSPKRPRSPRTYSPHHRSSNLPDAQPTPSILHHAVSPQARQSPVLPSDDKDQPTPRPRPSNKRANIFPSHLASQPQPEVRLQPPTPSSSTSKKPARTREVEAELDRERIRPTHKATASSGRREEVTEGGDLNASRHLNASRSNLSKSRIHLPDVTGLTNAVESPLKGMLKYYPYAGSDEPRETEARLLSVLNTIQTKLTHLEDENSISRRRVRELEHELEMCKREVARERTRVMEKETAILQNQRELERAVADAKKTIKGKGKARDASITNEGDATVRYKEAVEEKKALEALISTLRSHLTRLTAELSSHQELLVELRNLRESDAKALKERGQEIARLRDEVERLAGEVEVLRGVVEEGLKERRLSRENSISGSHTGSTSVSNSIGRQESREREVDVLEEEEDEGADFTGGGEADEEEEEEPEPFDPMSIPGSSRDNTNLPDKTMRTDRATAGGASGLVQSRSTRFIDDEELQRITADVEERRSEISGDSPSHFNSKVLEPSRSSSPAPRPSTKPALEVEEVMDESIRNPQWADASLARAASPALSSRSIRSSSCRAQHPDTRPSAPTPAHASGRHKRTVHHANIDDSEAFPQIRGERLEKLFFNAPEHDEKTCNVCHRKRGQTARPTSPSWLPSRLGQVGHRRPSEEEDEGFADGSDELEAGHDEDVGRDTKKVGTHPGRSARVPPVRDSYEKRKDLPQQTVLVRVIRELEDDFTHFKGVYVELADQYKDMDPVSDVPRRNLLAQHLREVVDILEQKGDQIASLYDLLTFQDKPDSDNRYQSRVTPQTTSSLGRASGSKRQPTFA